MKGWLSEWTPGETGQKNLSSFGGYWPAGCDSVATLPAGAASAAKETAAFEECAGHSMHSERSETPD